MDGTCAPPFTAPRENTEALESIIARGLFSSAWPPQPPQAPQPKPRPSSPRPLKSWRGKATATNTAQPPGGSCGSSGTYSTEAAVRPHLGASCVSRVPFSHLALALYRNNGAYDRLFSR